MGTSHFKWLPCLGYHFHIILWRKVQKRNIALLEQNRAASQNQRLTNALLFASAISALSWLPFVIVNYLVFVQGVHIPWRFLFVHIINILNLSNSIQNPFVYALRIPEFIQALRVSCCSRRQDVINRPGILERKYGRRFNARVTAKSNPMQFQSSSADLRKRDYGH